KCSHSSTSSPNWEKDSISRDHSQAAVARQAHIRPPWARSTPVFCAASVAPMTDRRLRVLYLNNAFPPGVSGRFPSLNPAGHPQETRMGQALGRLTDLRTVGLLPEEVYGQLEPRDGSIGLEHACLLWERRPELWHRWLSWRRLRRYYLAESARSG